jgi:hypothetical protein
MIYCDTHDYVNANNFVETFTKRFVISCTANRSQKLQVVMDVGFLDSSI